MYVTCAFFWFQDECQNHVRIVAKLSPELLLVCGTHAYRPRCRHYGFKVRPTKFFKTYLLEQ
jgi:hypothetical protein